MNTKILFSSIFLRCLKGFANVNAQNYRPGYLLDPKNQFIFENFDVVDSSGWLQVKPEIELYFSSFMDNK